MKNSSRAIVSVPWVHWSDDSELEPAVGAGDGVANDATDRLTQEEVVVARFGVLENVVRLKEDLDN